jgi:hypothetical protein
MEPERAGYTQLTKKNRNKVVQLLLGAVRDGALPHGKLTEVSLLFGVHQTTISRLWARAETSRTEGIVFSPEILSRNYGTENHLKYPRDLLLPAMLAIPSDNRNTQRAIMARLDVSQSVVKKALRLSDLIPHTNTAKPPLTDANKGARFEYAMAQIDPQDPNHFSEMMDVIHIDEKWFECQKRTQRGYLVRGEEARVRTTTADSRIPPP